MAFKLTPEQQAVVDSRGGELLVSAAAGSGKTRVLVERLLSRVEQEGRNLDEFLVITFTKAAAAELRSKILSELNQRLAQEPDNRHLRRQTTLIYRAQISTIHAFCTSFLRENCHLLNLESDFRVADESEAELLRTQTLDRLLEQRYESMDEGGFGALVDALSAGRDDKKLVEITLDIHRRIQAHSDPEGWLRRQSAALRWEEGTDAGATPWGKLLLRDERRQVGYVLSRLDYALKLTELDENLYSAYSGPFTEALDNLRSFYAALDEGWDAARSCSAGLFPKLNAARKVGDVKAKERAKAIWDECKKSMGKLEERFESDSATLLADLAAVAPPVEELFRLVSDLDAAFSAAKEHRKLLDFNDLEHLTLRALTDSEGKPSPLALQWRSRYAEVMVDEYQDTNAVQNAIFDALTDEGRNLFQVGDVKQSIYRFRLADPTIFLHKYHSFPPEELAKPGQSRLLVLSRNFRSRKGVLDGVNFVFSALMTRDFGEIDYTADQRLYPGRADAEAEGTAVELDIVDLATLEREEQEAKIPKDQVEARFVAQRARQLLEEGYEVQEGDTLRPLRAEDIAILYRSPGSVMHHLTSALDEQGVSWQSEGFEDFFETTEVSVALSYLEVIDNPRQDVPLLSVLRGPLYAFTPDQLSALRGASPETDLYGCVEKGALAGEEHCQRFLSDLKMLRLDMLDSSCAALLWTIYDRMGLLGLCSAMQGGQRRQENLLAFYDYARSFEQTGHKGVFAFVHQLRQLLERGKSPGAVSASAGGGVQIMSIHKSKGLEFPVVILAGLNREFNRMDEYAPMLFHPKYGVGPKLLDSQLRIEVPTLARTAVQLQMERERRAEELRLLYVAMTRAKERLIMTMAFQEAEKELDKLAREAAPVPEPEALEKQKSVGRWLLLCALCRKDARELWLAEAPDEIIDTEEHWDIHLVPTPEDMFAPAQPAATLTQAQAPDAPGEDEAALLRSLSWAYPHKDIAMLPSKVTATQMKGRTLDEEAAEDTPQRSPLPLEFRRPDFEALVRPLSGAQMGTAVHTVMEHIDLDRADTPEGVQSELARLVTEGHLTEEEAAAVNPAMVARFWASPLGREAMESGSLRREFKFSVLAPAARFYPGTEQGEELLVQGVVDCCFEDLWGFTVVDFKTDKVRHGGEAEAAEQYRGQVQVYAAALEEVFQKSVHRRVVWFLRTGKGVEL